MPAFGNWHHSGNNNPIYPHWDRHIPPSLKIVLAAEHAKLFNQQDLKILPLHGKILLDLKLPPEQAEKIPIPVIQGAERLAELRSKRGSLDIPQIQKANAILTNYETVRGYQLDLAQVQWSVIVLDEAQ